MLWVAGVVLIVVGYSRARGPWARYQALKAQDANVARYESWRGGVRGATSKTGASVAMELLRRQARIGGAHRDRRVRARLPRLPHPLSRQRPGSASYASSGSGRGQAVASAPPILPRSTAASRSPDAPVLGQERTR